MPSPLEDTPLITPDEAEILYDPEIFKGIDAFEQAIVKLEQDPTEENAADVYDAGRMPSAMAGVQAVRLGAYAPKRTKEFLALIGRAIRALRSVPKTSAHKEGDISHFESRQRILTPYLEGKTEEARRILRNECAAVMRSKESNRGKIV